MKKLLIVDDDLDDRDMFCEALVEVKPECQCYTANNGRSAIRALENNEIERPDLIFLDLNMPLMNGWQFLSLLKKKDAYEKIPVIIYSTSSYPEDAEKARLLGALYFFIKPSSFKEIKNRLASIMERIEKGELK